VSRGPQSSKKPSFMASGVRSSSVDRLMGVARISRARTARSGLRLFTKGFDTPDLKEAKALLEALAT
jgi:hypothetical protein